MRFFKRKIHTDEHFFELRKVLGTHRTGLQRLALQHVARLGQHVFGDVKGCLQKKSDARSFFLFCRNSNSDLLRLHDKRQSSGAVRHASWKRAWAIYKLIHLKKIKNDWWFLEINDNILYICFYCVYCFLIILYFFFFDIL